MVKLGIPAGELEKADRDMRRQNSIVKGVIISQITLASAIKSRIENKKRGCCVCLAPEGSGKSTRINSTLFDHLQSRNIVRGWCVGRVERKANDDNDLNETAKQLLWGKCDRIGDSVSSYVPEHPNVPNQPILPYVIVLDQCELWEDHRDLKSFVHGLATTSHDSFEQIAGRPFRPHLVILVFSLVKGAVRALLANGGEKVYPLASGVDMLGRNDLKVQLPSEEHWEQDGIKWTKSQTEAVVATIMLDCFDDHFVLPDKVYNRLITLCKLGSTASLCQDATNGICGEYRKCVYNSEDNYKSSVEEFTRVADTIFSKYEDLACYRDRQWRHYAKFEQVSIQIRMLESEGNHNKAEKLLEDYVNFRATDSYSFYTPLFIAGVVVVVGYSQMA